MKTGKSGIPLTEDMRDALYDIMGKNYWCLVETAEHINITYRQLYYPLRGTSNCSRESYQKITRYLKRKGYLDAKK